MMYEIIRTKRNGGTLSKEAIDAFIKGYSDGTIPDYQAAALIMAIFIRGMEPEELGTWTRAMLHSGSVLDLSAIPGRKVDKHSTGGVGDKISLILAPLVAAAGVKVPMISGRGLGHTGGTLDKLESIPGFDVNLTEARFAELVDSLGLCLIGQTGEIAPADKKLYALRDVTATVDSIPLIASSIMSKKLAEGIDALVLDVKVGSGAFMKTLDDADALARTLVGIGATMGKDAVALITDMSQPLGTHIGNGLEMIESIDILKGKGPADSTELTMALGVEMLLLAHITDDRADARRRLEGLISSGDALAKLVELIEAQGGDPRVVDDYAIFGVPERSVAVPAPAAGVVHAIDTERIGRAVVRMGGGREKVDDVIDHGVGITTTTRLGDEVTAGRPLAELWLRPGQDAERLVAMVADAYTIEEGPLEAPPLIHRRLTHEEG